LGVATTEAVIVALPAPITIAVFPEIVIMLESLLEYEVFPPEPDVAFNTNDFPFE